MILFRSLLLTFIFSGSLTAFSQQNPLESLDSLSGMVIKQIRQNESEKAYLSTDKSIYTAGESLWFRSFLLRSAAEKISTRSKYLFVDLVNEKDSVFGKSILYAKTQQTGGRLQLPHALPTGHYWLRAFTRSMINGYPEGAAVVPLYVVNPADPNPSRAVEKNTTANAGEPPVTVKVFAEGGNLVTGINTTLGILVYDKAGNPLSLSGSVRDNTEAVVASFNTNELGLASAGFSPDSRRRYKAVVTFEGKEVSTPLPRFNAFAGQLSVTREGTGLLKLRTILEDSVYRKDAITYVLGLSRDSLCFAGSGAGNYETVVSSSSFPAGIATFLLFDKNFRLLSERSVYMNGSQYNLSASLDKAAYTKQAKATLFTSVLDKAGRPVPASLTVAVSAEAALFQQEAFTPGHLLLRAQKAGLSNWDLLRLNRLSETDIDLLLMAGPSLYKQALAAKSRANETADDSLFFIHGRIATSKGEPVAGQPLNLISKTGDGIFLPGTTDAAGRFSFALPGYPDSSQFVLQLDNRKDKTESLRINLENMPFPRFATPDFLKQKLMLPSPKRTAYLRQYADTTISEGKGWLDPVRMNAKEKPYENDRRRIASSGTIIPTEQLQQLGMGNVGLAVLRMPGVQLINGFLRFYGPDQFSGATANSEPAVLMDGNQISLGGGGTSSSPVIQYLNSLNPREIDFIEVLKGPEASIYGIRGGEGVIHIHSASQVHQDFSVKDGNVYKFFRPGYANPVLFPVDSYRQKETAENTVTDARSTLFWSENSLVGTDGKLAFTFFTPDVGSAFQVVITGITANGDLLYKTLSFTNH